MCIVLFPLYISFYMITNDLSKRCLLTYLCHSLSKTCVNSWSTYSCTSWRPKQREGDYLGQGCRNIRPALVKLSWSKRSNDLNRYSSTHILIFPHFCASSLIFFSKYVSKWKSDLAFWPVMFEVLHLA